MTTRNKTSRRTLLITIGILAGAVLLVGGYQVYNRLNGRPDSADDVKEEIVAYLQDKSGRKTFATSVPAGITNDSAIRRNRRRADGDAKNRKDRRDERPQPLAATKELREKLAAAGNYPAIYGIIGEELWICDQLQREKRAAEKEISILLAMEAAEAARVKAVDTWLAARICEAYLWPELGTADQSDIRGLSSDALLQFADNVFREASETNNIIRNYKFLLKGGGAAGDRRADMARQRLAGVYEEMGEFKVALQYLSQIQNTNNGGVRRRIADLQERIKQQ